MPMALISSPGSHFDVGGGVAQRWPIIPIGISTIEIKETLIFMIWGSAANGSMINCVELEDTDYL